MRCPECGKRLHKIPYMDGEYVCHNEECSTMDGANPQEFYGITQKEIDERYAPQ